MNNESQVPLRLCRGSVIHWAFRSLAKRFGLPEPSLKAQATVLAALCWVPLAVMVAVSSEKAQLREFGSDLTVHSRFLVALPLLLLAERIVEYRTGAAARVVLSSRLLETQQKEDARALVSEIQRKADRIGPDLFFLMIVILAPFFTGELAIRPQNPAWENGNSAVLWLTHFARPIFQLVVLRWMYRMLLWSWFLLRFSRLKPRILAHHPDGAGGLDFLSWTQNGFAALALAVAVVLVSDLYGAGLAGAELKAAMTRRFVEILMLNLALFLAPLIFFVPVMAKQKALRMRELRRLSERMAFEFKEAWIDRPHGADPPARYLDTGEFSSMTDYISTALHGRGMRVMVWDRRSVIRYAAASGLPFLPLLLKSLGAEQAFALLTRFIL